MSYKKNEIVIFEKKYTAIAIQTVDDVYFLKDI